MMAGSSHDGVESAVLHQAADESLSNTGERGADSSAPRAGVHGLGGAVPALKFVLRRVLAGIVTLFVVSVAIFAATNVLPGNAAVIVLGRNATPGKIATLDRQLNINHSALVNYLHWLSGAWHGSFGFSSVALAEGSKTTVSSTLGTPLLNSLILAGIAALILIPLALLVGTVAGLTAGRKTDRLLSLPLLVIGGLPEFVLGTLLITIFATKLGLLPAVSLLSPGESPLSVPNELVLPVMTLVIGVLSAISRQVRAGVIEVMHQDYVKTATLNGIPHHRVVLRYVLRNALAPSIQVIAHALQYLIGGLIIVESVFTYPGMGEYLVSAVTSRDVPEIQAAAIVLATLYIAINIAADLIVVFIVPRLRTELR